SFDPQNRLILFYQGWAYDTLGRWSEAAAALKRYVASYPENVFANAMLAVDCLNLGDRDTAHAEKAQVEQAIADSPDSAIGYLALAWILDAEDHPGEALLVVEKGMRLDPTNADSYAIPRGWAYTLLGRSKEAIAALKNCRNPGVRGLAFLAVNNIEVGQEGAARAEMADVIRLNGQFTAKLIFPRVNLGDKALSTRVD